jgi:hypothetical protein
MLVTPASALQAVTALTGTVLLALGNANIRLRATIEYGVLWIVALLFSVHYGLDQVAIAFSIASLLYTPRLLMLALPLIGCSLTLYLRTLVTPTVATCLCMAAYQFYYTDFLKQLLSS